jgi:hypothetical protein
MPDLESEELRRALRAVQSSLLDAIGRVDPRRDGDWAALDALQDAYARVAAVLKELEGGRWPGRSVKQGVTGTG